MERAGAISWGTPAWVLGWWRAYRPSARLRLVAVFDHDELVAVGPFCEVGPAGLRLVRFLGELHQPKRIVTAPGRESAAGLVWDALRRRGSALDLFDLEDAPGSGYRSLVEDPRWSVFDEPADSCSRITVTTTADDYLAARGSLSRDKERVRRKLERDGRRVEVVWADTQSEIEAVLPAMASIAAVAQRDRYKPGELDELAGGSLPAAVGAMARAGRAHVTLVRVDGHDAAFHIALTGGASASGHLMAYATEWAPYAPGVRCLEESFRWAVGTGVREFDLGAGIDDYKRRWGGDESATRRVIAAPSAAGLTLAQAGITFRARVTDLRDRGAARRVVGTV